MALTSTDYTKERVRQLTFFHSGLKAYVKVNPRAKAVRFRAWWKGGEVTITSPAAATFAHLLDAIDRLKPLLLKARPTALYHAGQTIYFPEGTITINECPGLNGCIESQTEIPSEGRYRVTIGVPPGIDFDNPGITKSISDTICKRMRWIAHLELPALAKKVADRIGRHPEGWEISRGHHVLGNCDARGIIRLSLVLIFLPDNLREYVICHEIAHLSEMNHSARFHALLNSYLDGKEAALKKELKAFRWPIAK